VYASIANTQLFRIFGFAYDEAISSILLSVDSTKFSIMKATVFAENNATNCTIIIKDH